MNKVIKKLVGIILSISMIIGTGIVSLADNNIPVKNVDGSYTVHTNMACTVWKAPQTTNEYRGKKVSEGYAINIYPTVYQSNLNDGKTFYKTVKGSYVLCKCVVEDVPAVKVVKVEENYLKQIQGTLAYQRNVKQMKEVLANRSYYEKFSWYILQDSVSGHKSGQFSYGMIIPKKDANGTDFVAVHEELNDYIVDILKKTYGDRIIGSIKTYSGYFMEQINSNGDCLLVCIADVSWK